MIVNRYLLTILALHKAAEQGHAEVGFFLCVCVLQRLLRYFQVQKLLPSMMCVQMVALLLSKGADRNISDRDGRLPASVAATPQIAAMLHDAIM